MPLVVLPRAAAGVTERSPPSFELRDHRERSPVSKPSWKIRSFHSTAQMSQAAPYGRATPRWSVEVEQVAPRVSTAGLSSAGMCVQVGPPLSCRGPSLTSATLVSSVPVALKQMLVESMLWPAEEFTPPPTQVPSMIVPSKMPEGVAPLLTSAEGPPPLHVFAVSVTRVSWTAAGPPPKSLFQIPPPVASNRVAELPLIVLLVMVRVP